jgi:hypothetical protein
VQENLDRRVSRSSAVNAVLLAEILADADNLIAGEDLKNVADELQGTT